MSDHMKRVRAAVEANELGEGFGAVVSMADTRALLHDVERLRASAEAVDYWIQVATVEADKREAYRLQAEKAEAEIERLTAENERLLKREEDFRYRKRKAEAEVERLRDVIDLIKPEVGRLATERGEEWKRATKAEAENERLRAVVGAARLVWDRWDSGGSGTCHLLDSELGPALAALGGGEDELL